MNYVCYFDGACSGNGTTNARAGWAYRIEWDGRVHSNSGRVVGKQTNQVAELTALVECLKAILRAYTNERLSLEDEIVIYGDSQYAVKGWQEWMDTWASNDWKRSGNKPVDNVELWKQLYMLKQVGFNILVWHVKGHAGYPGNEAVDQAAVAACKEEIQS